MVGEGNNPIDDAFPFQHILLGQPGDVWTQLIVSEGETSQLGREQIIEVCFLRKENKRKIGHELASIYSQN